MSGSLPDSAPRRPSGATPQAEAKEAEAKEADALEEIALSRIRDPAPDAVVPADLGRSLNAEWGPKLNLAWLGTHADHWLAQNWRVLHRRSTTYAETSCEVTAAMLRALLTNTPELERSCVAAHKLGLTLGELREKTGGGLSAFARRGGVRLRAHRDGMRRRRPAVVLRQAQTPPRRRHPAFAAIVADREAATVETYRAMALDDSVDAVPAGSTLYVWMPARLAPSPPPPLLPTPVAQNTT
jgi:hypothetical protein